MITRTFENSLQVTANIAKNVDWANHPLGLPSTWPATLHITLGIVFNSRQPMFVFWGKKHYCFYNDAYIPILGNQKHPLAMGKPGEEVWPEIWPVTFEQIEIAESGKSTWHVNRMIPVHKNGKETESYFTYGYSPIFSESGEVCGAFVSASETTQGVLAQRAVEESSRRLQQFFMQTPAPMVLLIGPEHKFELANPPYEKFVGRKVTGKKLLEAFSPDEISDFLNILNGVYKTGKPYHGREVPVQNTDENGAKQTRYLNIDHIPFRDADGTIIGILAYHQDITDEVVARQAVELSEKNLNLALNSGNIGFWSTDLITTKATLSNNLMHDWGIDPERFKNTADEAYERIHPDDRDTIKREVRAAIENQTPYKAEYRVIRPNGEMIWIYAAGKAFYDNNGLPTRVSGISINISERKQLLLNLQKAKEAAEAASLAKSGFLANMSHEIRTPLGVMMGFADLALHHDDLPEDVENYLKAISRNGQILTHMIGEVLDLSKIEASKMEFESTRFHLPNLLDEIVSSMDVRASEKGIHLILEKSDDLPVFVKSDPTRFRQILVNLIGNSIKFTERGEVRVVTRVKPSVAGNTAVEVLVKDTGIGLSTEQIQNLFKPFTQADSTMTRKYGGTGLGLALAKQVAQAMNGDVTLKESAPGAGSIFSCVVEMTIAPDNLESFSQDVKLSSSAPAPRSDSELDGLRVLLVEDSVDNQVLFSRYLKSAGASIVFADNGEEGVEKAMAENYDIVLMDIQMPKKNGHEATADLRKKGFQKPIIALTAHAFKEERDRAMAGGFTDYLTKPLKRKTLVDTILRWVQ